jgi:hypothetical protein
MSDRKRGAPPKADPKVSHLHLRLTPREKAKLVRDADGDKLSVYCRRRLGLPEE